MSATRVVEMAATVLIVDDHSGFRARLRKLLERAGYDVVGEAADQASALVEARRLSPDALLLDVQLPDGDGFAIADQIGRLPGAPRIVLISSREATDYSRLLERSPAVGFIHKPDLTPGAVAELIGAPL